MNSKTEEIILKTRRRLFGANLGQNITAFKGDGLDFREIREYTPGDDIKKINWKVTAKSGGSKLYVNEFNQERELNIVFLFMVSGNIYFGTQKPKQETMAEALSMLSQAALMQDNKVTTIFFSDKVQKLFKPSKKQDLVYSTVDYALELNPVGSKVDYKEAFDYISATIKQKSLIFIIGDFYEDIDVTTLLKHELYSVIVRDEFEENPKLLGEITLKDLATQKLTHISGSNRAKKAYKDTILEHDSRIYEHFDIYDVKHTKVYTNEDIYTNLLNLCVV